MSDTLSKAQEAQVLRLIADMDEAYFKDPRPSEVLGWPGFLRDEAARPRIVNRAIQRAKYADRANGGSNAG